MEGIINVSYSKDCLAGVIDVPALCSGNTVKAVQ